MKSAVCKEIGAPLVFSEVSPRARRTEELHVHLLAREVFYIE